MKHKAVKLIIVFLCGLIVSSSYVYMTWGEIKPPKTVIPSKKVKKTITPKEMAKQMLQDMYPNEAVLEVKYSDENYDRNYKNCINTWCIEENDVNNNVLIIRSRNSELNSFYFDEDKDKMSYHIKESVQINISEMTSIEVENERKKRESYIQNNSEKVEKLGREYYFYSSNTYLVMTTNSTVFLLPFQQHSPSLVEPIGYKHNLPFKEYFEKIQFED